MREKFEDRNLYGSISINLKEKGYWKARKEELCNSIISVISRFSRQGYTLTLRQLYYQLVAGDIIPNHDKVYKKLSSVLDDLRYSGYIDWDAIEDRGRVPYIPYYVEGISDAIQDAVRHYRLDRQTGQNIIVEVWTEKDAISGILKRITSKYHVQLVVNKGYSSSTAMYRAYRRFVKYIKEGKQIVVLYFGDHDPSGLDMIRDIEDRIRLFLCKGNELDEASTEWWEERKFDVYDLADTYPNFSEIALLAGNHDLSDDQYEKILSLFDEGKNHWYLEDHDSFSVIPIGLTMTQINQYNPPPNPAKLTDPRAKWYVEQFGAVSWEVDALDPAVMERIVEDAIKGIIDNDQFESVMSTEKSQIAELKQIADQYN